MYHNPKRHIGCSLVIERKKSNNASFLYTLKGVFWAMIGIRKSSGYDEDIKKITPKQAIIVGMIAVLAFILTLYLVVNIVIGQSAG